LPFSVSRVKLVEYSQISLGPPMVTLNPPSAKEDFTRRSRKANSKSLRMAAAKTLVWNISRPPRDPAQITQRPASPEATTSAQTLCHENCRTELYRVRNDLGLPERKFLLGFQCHLLYPSEAAPPQIYIKMLINKNFPRRLRRGSG